MRSPNRRLAVAVAVAAATSLSFTACAKKDDSSSTGGGAAGSVPAGKTVDYAKLEATLNGSGSSFQKGFNDTAVAEMKKVAPKLVVNYAGGGSSKGKKDLQDGIVDFAGTDSLVKDEDKAKFKGEFLYFPTVSAPITVSFNVKGVDKLNLSASTVAKIFQGDIKKWNDAAIKADNPDATLPDADIKAVHRADGSGTTSNFTKYLKAAAGSDWKLDAGDTVNWPADSQAGNGNGGVAQAVKSTDGAIGYVDLSDAKASGLKFAAIKNKAGKFVEPTVDGAKAAVDGASVKDDLTYSPLDAAGEKAYPITSPTWIIVYAKQTDKAKGEAVKGLLNYLLTEGQALAPTVDYAALPEGLQKKAVAQLDKIQVG